MNPLRRIFERTLGRFLGRLRFPQLFVLTFVVFLVNLAVPDVIPFVDEILLALGSLILGSLKERAEHRKEERVGGSTGRRIEERSSKEDAS
ncbi:MAG: DUF6116 family protein [Longimicrobiales bacterium]|nr:DUF6116 family protein [Longimicrobiales bacterium]